MHAERSNQTQPSNTAALERATGRPWPEWLTIFHQAGAATLTHSEIARVALEAMPAELQNPEWWAQGAAIAFEQHAGLRVPGQSSTGEFRVGASRTVSLDRDEAVSRWQALSATAGPPLGHSVTGERLSRTEKRSFWRAGLVGAGKIEFAAEPKGEGRSVCSIQHTGLTDAESIEVWRAHWKSRLAAL